MKFFFPIIMAFTILVGLGSALTPMLADRFFPVPDVIMKKADPDSVANALHQWFEAVPNVEFTETRGLNRTDATGRISWMVFSVDPRTVSRFIHARGLTQKALTPEILGSIFANATPAAIWWDPAELTRETWFSGHHSGREIGLIYNADMQRGYLVTRLLMEEDKQP